MKASYKDESTKKRDVVSASVGTFIFFSSVFVLFLIFGFRTKLPLPEEQGIEVMLGEMEFGSPSASLPIPPQAEVQPPTSSSEESIEAAEDNVLTSTEIDVPVVSEKKVDKPLDPKETTKENIEETTTKETEEVSKEPEKQSNPLFEYKKSAGDPAKGEGADDGNQGSEDGNPDSKSPGYGGNSGVSINLGGRGVRQGPPKIEDNSQKVERVVIEIVVNKSGNVVRANATFKGGGTTTTGSLVEKAIAASKKVRFEPDPNGADEQFGTITFDFKLN